MKPNRQERQQLTIMTHDPSMTAWGWAVVRSGKILATGCIKTEPNPAKLRIRKGDDTIRRAQEIIRQLLNVTEEYGVTYYLSELPHGSQNASAARMIGLVIGLVQGIADCLQIGVEWYSEADAKKALLNKKSATKGETVTAITGKYDWRPTGIKYKDEAVADALAVYHVATLQSPVASFFR